MHAWIERNDAGQSRFIGAGMTDECTLGSISCGHHTIVVGSYDAHKPAKPMSFFSSSGPTRDGRQKPEVSAPGHDVRAAHSRTGTGVTDKSGTSMAAPLVTGAIAALLSEAHHLGVSLDSDEIRAIVAATARNTGPPGWHKRYGARRLDVKGMIDELHRRHPAPPPVGGVPVASARRSRRGEHT